MVHLCEYFEFPVSLTKRPLFFQRTPSSEEVSQKKEETKEEAHTESEKEETELLTGLPAVVSLQDAPICSGSTKEAQSSATNRINSSVKDRK